MNNIVLSDEEVIELGQGRWYRKNQREYGKLLLMLALCTLIAIIPIEFWPKNFIALVIPVAVELFALFMYYRERIKKPMAEAGKQFLKEWRS